MLTYTRTFNPHKKYMHMYSQYLRTIPHQKLLEWGFSTLRPFLCLICTNISKKKCLFDQYQNTPQVLAVRSFLVAGFDTRWVLRRVSCGVHTSISFFLYTPWHVNGQCTHTLWHTHTHTHTHTQRRKLVPTHKPVGGGIEESSRRVEGKPSHGHSTGRKWTPWRWKGHACAGLAASPGTTCLQHIMAHRQSQGSVPCHHGHYDIVTIYGNHDILRYAACFCEMNATFGVGCSIFHVYIT